VFRSIVPKGALLPAPPADDVPRNADEAFDRAIRHNREGRPDLAIPFLERALELEPSCAKAAVELANTHADSGRAEEAAAVLDTYLGRYPLAAVVRYARGNLKLRASKLDEALEDFKRCVAEQPDHEGPRTKLVVTLCRLGRREEAAQALAAFTRSASTDPRAAEMLSKLFSRTFGT
jgi:thioredoxin-like negative regulator of GroEL